MFSNFSSSIQTRKEYNAKARMCTVHRVLEFDQSFWIGKEVFSLAVPTNKSELEGATYLLFSNFSSKGLCISKVSFLENPSPKKLTKYLTKFCPSTKARKTRKKAKLPARGIKPRISVWKAGLLTIRPRNFLLEREEEV